MVDRSSWSVRNKENLYFAKAFHLRLAKNRVTKPLIGVVVGVTLEKFADFVTDAFGVTVQQFSEWFLASGFWDTDKNWSDSIVWNFGPFPWTFSWFLAQNRINVFGFWDDGKGW